MTLQERIDEAYPRYYDVDVIITKEQWIELLQNSEIFNEKNLEYMKMLYSFENHVATNTEISEKLGVSRNESLGLINALSKRIANELELIDLPKRKDDRRPVYWYILFYGRYTKDKESGVFEWKLKPALAEALQELYPELQSPVPKVKKVKNVATAVWLGAAILAYEAYQRNEQPTAQRMYFKQSDIQKKAQELCEKRVHNPRISSWYNADHEDSTYNYLRAGENKSRRLTYTGEFNGVKEQPEDLVLHNIVDTTFGKITIAELQRFVEKEYTDLMKSEMNEANMKKSDILSLLDFIEEYGGKDYKSPDIVDEPDKSRYSNIKTIAQNAINEFEKIAAVCEESFELKSAGKAKWLNASNIELRDYLWMELKHPQYLESPSSLSIFAEIMGEQSRFRFSVEFKDKGSSSKEFENHHRFLQKDINSATDQLFYVLGGNNDKENMKDLIGETTEEVKEKVLSGEYKKVQISRAINREVIEEFEDANQFIQAMKNAVNALIPFYDLAIGKEEVVGEEDKISSLKDLKNLILYGPPGTGKTYHTVHYAVAIIENKSLEEINNEPYKDLFARYLAYKDEGRVAFTTFHQSYGYEEFIEGIKPKLTTSEENDEDEVTGDIQYEIAPGVFKEFVEHARDHSEPYVFIVDEINRGNISKIFGELITLIEPTKRLGEAEEATAKLPYTKKEFGVPNNVYIIGTMNTADRSIALMDTALRRRFTFIEMMPDVTVLESLDDLAGINIPKMLTTMNERIKHLYDREHTIGHSYFTTLMENPTLDHLAEIFLNKIIPLLQEYFYEDYERIQLVLGDNAKENDEFKFVLDEKIKSNEVFKGNLDLDIPEKTYTIQEKAFYKAESYKQIY